MTTGAVDPGKAWRATHGIPVVAAFDGYRALAVLGVVLFHIFEICGVTAVAGKSLGGILIWGVLPRSIIIFFIVSGFVMFLPTAVRHGDFGRVSSFAIGRAARILPAYWLSLVVALLLLVTFAHPAITPPGLPPIGSVVAHFALLETPALLVAGPVGVDGVTVGNLVLGFGVIPPVWTMSVEAGFYLVLPLVATAYFRRPLIGLACAAALVVAWHAVAVNIGDVASAFGLNASPATEARFRDFYASQFPSWALALATGMTGAWAYVRLRDRVAAPTLERGALWTLVATVPVAALVVYVTGHEAVNDINPLNGLFARQSIGLTLAYPLVMGTAMVAFSLAPVRVQRPMANEPVRGLADVSYSVYLIHFAVIWFALSQLSLPDDGSLWSAVAWSALVFPVSILYAYLSANLLERPIRRWAQRFRDQRRPAPSLAAETSTPVGADGAGPPVSVVIPTLNRASWLQEAMDSVLSQDYPNLELFVVDDGSTDETPALLAEYGRRYPEERFRFVRQENSGQANALNRGNGLARGEILGYLSDDDLLAPGAVSRLASELVADPGAAVAYPEYLTIDETGKVEDAVRPIEYSPVAALRLHDTIIGPGGLARRWALESAGGWDPSYRWMGDLILWMGVGLAGRAIRVEEPLASWRKHSGSVTIELSPGHAREHLAVVEHGLAMPGLPSLSRSTGAEALRNACLFGALFGGESGTWPQERFVPFDLHRKRISAWSAGLAPEGDVDWDAAERGADACRELVTLTAELAELRAARAGAAGVNRSSPSFGANEDPVGMAAARRRLREVGVLPDDRGSYADGVGEREMRLALLEAAVACGYEVEPGSSRFFILDRQRAPLSDAELDALLSLTIGGSHHELLEAAQRKRRELEGIREPSEA